LKVTNSIIFTCPAEVFQSQDNLSSVLEAKNPEKEIERR
jgi:hypothetical protein